MTEDQEMAALLLCATAAQGYGGFFVIATELGFPYEHPAVEIAMRAFNQAPSGEGVYLHAAELIYARIVR